jgi:hypothetical protein
MRCGSSTLKSTVSALAIPVVLALAGFWFTTQQEERQTTIENQRAQQAQKIEN